MGYNEEKWMRKRTKTTNGGNNSTKKSERRNFLWNFDLAMHIHFAREFRHSELLYAFTPYDIHTFSQFTHTSMQTHTHTHTMRGYKGPHGMCNIVRPKVLFYWWSEKYTWGEQAAATSRAPRYKTATIENFTAIIQCDEMKIWNMQWKWCVEGNLYLF